MDTVEIIRTLQRELKEYNNVRVQTLLTTLYDRFNRIDKQVVPKKIVRGPRGAYFYVNSRGEIAYLNERQLQRFRDGELIGCIGDACVLSTKEEERLDKILAKQRKRKGLSPKGYAGYAPTSDFLDQVSLSSTYFDQLSPFETQIKTNGETNDPRKYHALREKALPWTPKQKLDWGQKQAEAQHLLDLILPELLDLPSWATKEKPWQKWKLALFQNFEFGFPHTLDDVIFLPTSLKPSSSILAHEQIHVLQRLYPDWFVPLYTEWGFTPTSLAKKPARWISNPDVPELWKKKGHIPIIVWEKGLTLKKMNVETGRLSPTTDRQPNEELAYLIGGLV